MLKKKDLHIQEISKDLEFEKVVSASLKDEIKRLKKNDDCEEVLTKLSEENKRLWKKDEENQKKIEKLLKVVKVFSENFEDQCVKNINTLCE